MKSVALRKKAPTYRCARCNKKLRGIWIYSKHTSLRYCAPGSGCGK